MVGSIINNFKSFIMKKILILLFIVVVVVPGCIKDKVYPLDNTDTPYLKFSLVTPTATFPLISLIPDASLSEQYVSFADVGMKAKLEGPITAPSDISVKYEIDAAGLTKLNADALAKDPTYKPFFLLPDSTYKILIKEDVIKKGGVYADKDIDNIVLYSDKIDPATNYILPLKLTSSNYTSSKGTATIFYYIIGNPLAGPYLHSYQRWNGTADTTTAPNSTVGTNVPVVITPITPNSVLLPEYYLEVNFGEGLALTFNNNSGTLSSFNVSIPPSTQAVLAANSFSVPVLKLISAQIVGNASTKYAGSTFRIYMEVINNTGALRTLINKFVKQ